MTGSDITRAVRPRTRLVLLVSALVFVLLSVALFVFLTYIDAHKYDQDFEWVSARVTQPTALVMIAALLLGLVFAVMGLLQRERR